MSYEMHLCRFQSDLETEGTITKQEWLHSIAHIGNLSYDNQAHSLTRNNDTEPLLYLNLACPNSASASADFILADNQRFDTLRLLAQHLDAYLWGDDTELYHFPGAENLEQPRTLKLPMSEFIEMMQANEHNTATVIAHLNGVSAPSETEMLIAEIPDTVTISAPQQAAELVMPEPETIEVFESDTPETQQPAVYAEAVQSAPASLEEAPSQSPKKGNWFLRLLGLR
jgi:hypothetical protein